MQWCPTLVQCGRSGVTVKREVARSNTRDVGGDSTVGQGPALGRQKAHNIAGLLIVSSSGCLGLRPFDPLLFEDLMSKLMGLLIVGVFGLAASYPFLLGRLTSKLADVLVVGVLRPPACRPLRVRSLMSKLMGFLLGRGGGI